MKEVYKDNRYIVHQIMENNNTGSIKGNGLRISGSNEVDAQSTGSIIGNALFFDVDF